MSTVLVVDDSKVDRTHAGNILAKANLEVLYAKDGREAISVVQGQSPDVVVTDLRMPDIDGLQLVQQLKATYPSLPVILMTAHGNEEIAVTALQNGAASYVPKKNISRDLEETVRSLLSVVSAQRAESQILDSLTAIHVEYVISHDVSVLRALIGQIQGYLRQLQVCDESDIIRISTALQESMVNSIEHGNLDMSSKLRELKDNTYAKLGKQRRAEPPYCDRRVFINCTFRHDEAKWVVRDEGSGFDPRNLPDPTDPANLEKVSGRGLLLIRTFMDEVTFNDSANEITMIKRKSAAS
jgi:CheY-like chemotaxis protein